MSARILFSTGSLYLHDTAQCFELAAEAGCDGMEVMCDERWSTRDPNYLCQLSAQYQQPVLVLHTPALHRTQRLMGWQNANTEVSVAERTLELAENVAAEAIVVHVPQKLEVFHIRTPKRNLMLPHWDNRQHEAKKTWMETTIPTLQAQKSVKLAFENLPTHRVMGHKFNPHHWNTVETWAVCAPYLTMDTTHWATHGINPLDTYRVAKERICHLHLSNYDGREHRLPHKGNLDLGALLREMAKDGFNGTITLELYPDSLEFDSPIKLRQNLKDSVAFCREHLG
jgi:sugar phosphate isomerase/epimerase